MDLLWKACWRSFLFLFQGIWRSALTASCLVKKLDEALLPVVRRKVLPGSKTASTLISIITNCTTLVLLVTMIIIIITNVISGQSLTPVCSAACPLHQLLHQPPPPGFVAAAPPFLHQLQQHQLFSIIIIVSVLITTIASNAICCCFLKIKKLCQP